jgi:hypothetical protein
MAVIAEWFEEMAGDEPIEAAVIGEHDSDYPGRPPFNGAPIGKVIPWAEAKPFLSYDYDNGYGGADCHPVYAWTPTRVLMIYEYDGATVPVWIPRNPVDVLPEFGGQS